MVRQRLVAVVCLIVLVASRGLAGNEFVAAPDTAETSAREGTVLYVSKLGDNSNGSTWAKAFHTIQAALLAVPDDQGAHRVIVRPDTYVEANLYPSQKGAAGAYNRLVGDVNGKLGSGTTGWVVIDSGDPSKGFKSFDWWSTIRATQKGWSDKHTAPTFSSIVWDRWELRGLYATGSDGGLFWDLTDKSGSAFTVIVADCVGIGRAFGGGFAGPVGRTGEPIVFRRCHLLCLDWWGDAGGVYARAHNKTMPNAPDAIFEECTLAGPDNALQAGNPGFDVHTRLTLKSCRLIVVNFSQPHGTPSSGVINSKIKGEHLHVDLDDCTLMGYKVFGSGDNKPIPYTTKGSVNAYVQFQQSVPKGFHRLGHWPVNVFKTLLPPEPPTWRDVLTSEGLVQSDLCELAPIVWKGRLCHMECVRPGSGGERRDYYLLLKDAETGRELARFGAGYGLACAHVHDGTLYAFASRFESNNWNDVTLFKSADLTNWESKVVLEQQSEHLFNSAVCAGPDGFVMAYESNDPTYPAFTTKFAVSKDLENWTKLPEAVFGTNRYTACPCIRYANGYYYLLYLERRAPRWFFETYIARSKDLRNWHVSSANPVLTPDDVDEGINASDPDMVEFDGKTLLYYAVGDQRTWMNIKRAVHLGSEQQFLERWFVNPGIEDAGTAAAVATVATARQETLDDQRARRTAWFNEAKFGLFVHWGLYSVPARNDKGPYVSWMMNNEGVPVAEYEKYAGQFNPTGFDATEWMKILKSAGMRYMIFTSKHHDGFCMFNSKLTDYDSVDRAAGRDFVRELIDAARAADVKIGLYYSTLDWHHSDYDGNLPKYVIDYLHGQVRELCTNYGKIDCIWFDGEWDHPLDTWRSADLIRMIRALQPGAFINDRVGKGERGKNLLCDFYTREQPVEIREATVFEQRRSYPWEACLTIGTSWGYKKGDTPLKSSAELIRTLVDVAARGGNVLLNVGPTADGRIPPEFVSRLQEIGEWLSRNGEGIYGTHRSPFSSLQAGRCTVKGNRLYVHLESHPGEQLRLPGLANEIRRAWFLASGQPLNVDNKAKSVAIPETLPDQIVTTVAVELDGSPVVK